MYRMVRMNKTPFGCLILASLALTVMSQAQQKAYPHLQIFLVPSQHGGKTSFIAFWDAAHQVRAGPFPLELMERAGLSASLDLTYSKTSEEAPSAARLKIARRDSTSFQGQEGLVLLDQPADPVADRGVSKMFPDGPFLVIGHKASSEGVLGVGNIMGEIQKKLLACERESRQELGAVLNSLKGAPSYGQVLKTVGSAFPPCPLQRS